MRTKGRATATVTATVIAMAIAMKLDPVTVTESATETVVAAAKKTDAATKGEDHTDQNAKIATAAVRVMVNEDPRNGIDRVDRRLGRRAMAIGLIGQNATASADHLTAGDRMTDRPIVRIIPLNPDVAVLEGQCTVS